jgi:hypothetical protein
MRAYWPRFVFAVQRYSDAHAANPVRICNHAGQSAKFVKFMAVAKDSIDFGSNRNVKL